MAEVKNIVAEIQQGVFVCIAAALAATAAKMVGTDTISFTMGSWLY